MLKISDFEKIKEIAMTLLYVDITETKFSPMIVSHPYTDSGFVPVGKGSDIKLINILESEENLEIWRKQVLEQIKKTTDIKSLLFRISKPYYFAFIKFAKPYLSREDLSELLGITWTQVEFSNRDKNLSKSEILKLFKKCNPEKVMDEDEYAEYNSLPAVLEIYRGIGKDTKAGVLSLSWTLSYDTAEWFSKRRSESGVVYKAKIEKKYVYAYFSGRNESEVIVDPKYLQEIERITE